MRALIFWDIDGTLLASQGLTERLLRQAIAQVYGPSPALDQLAMSGKTDQQIICEAHPERPATELLAALPAFTQAYLALLDAERAALRRMGRVLDGVLPALLGLADAGALQSVITGNLEPVARYKLGLFGLAPYLDLRIGAYGSDHADRTRLLPIALGRLAAQRIAAPQRVVVIGDTPADIACGRSAGARTVAVATGTWSAAQLAAAQADAVLPNLHDTALTLARVLGDDGARRGT